MKFPRPRHIEEFPGGRHSDTAADYDRLEEGYKRAILKARLAEMTERQRKLRGL